MSSSCICNYSNKPCRASTCVNIANAQAKATIIQKRIWNQVRAPASTYLMNLSVFTSGASRLASGKNVNWNQMSDRVNAAKQPALNPTHGNSLRRTLTSDKPGAGTPGGAGVDVKHDSYARFLNKKKASNLKTQTQNIATVPSYGNKVKSINLVSNSINCCT
jgi:hypothetical protein